MPDPVLLTGPRGSLAYTQPKHYCDRCRRSFFPDGGNLGNRSTEHGDHEGAANDDLGRSEQQLCDRGRGPCAVAGIQVTIKQVRRIVIPRAVPVVDLMHALSYAWGASASIEVASYRQWAEWIGRGEVSRVMPKAARSSGAA